MGIDLTVYPQGYPYSESEWWLGYDRLGFRRDYDLFSCFGLDRGKYNKVVQPKEIPDDVSFDIYTETGLEKDIKKDPYGDKLTYIYAEEIDNIPDEVIENIFDWNKAVLKMLKELKEKDVVILYWH